MLILTYFRGNVKRHGEYSALAGSRLIFSVYKKKKENKKMRIEDRKAAMREAILSVPLTGRGYNDFVNDIVEKLTELGAFVPPVKVGDVCYVACPAFTSLDKPMVDTFEPQGYGVDKDGNIFVLDECNEIFTVDSSFCRLTKEAAEEDLKNAEYIDGGCYDGE